jgi:hypothetical protein
MVISIEDDCSDAHQSRRVGSIRVSPTTAP